MKTERGRTELLALAHTAKTFGQRPSSLLRLTDEVIALDFDCAAALVLIQAEAKALKGDDDDDNDDPRLPHWNVNVETHQAS